MTTTTPRRATPHDRDLFLSLWHRFLIEAAEAGSEILPTDRTLDFYGRLFDLYVSGEQPGVVAILYPFGVSMSGDATPGYDSKFGRSAIGWGTYVLPEFRGKHRADQLRQFTIDELRSLGFDTLLGAVGRDDLRATRSLERVEGVVFHQRTYYRALR